MQNLKERKIDIKSAEVEDVNMGDYPDFADAFLARALWAIDDTELTEDELVEMTVSNTDWFYEKTMDYMF